MNNGIFRRVEEKYFLNYSQKEELLHELSQYITKDTYYKSNILNIYFDNLNNDLVIRSIDKPIYKDKVRLRSYNVPTLDDEVFLEIKNKYQNVTNKRRINLKLSEFYNYLNNKGNMNNQIMKEINYLFNYYQLKPTYFIAYDRLSFKGIEDQNLRITIDSNLRSRNKNLRLELGDQGDKFFDDDRFILEIKTLNSIPLWLSDILSKLKIYPISFSKYGEIYKKEMFDLC